MSKKFSVIVCNYNSDQKDIAYTLDSIISQKKIDYEIIFSDDGSKDNPRSCVEHYFERHEFNDFKIRIGEKNIGTVSALYDALLLAEGELVKPIGVGDSLAYENVLFDMYTFMKEKESRIAFSMLSPFRKIDGKIVYVENASIPCDLSCWICNEYVKAKEHVIVFNDQISGSSMFYEKKYALYLMDLMRNCTIYMEDLCQYIALLEGERISFFPNKCVLYEVSEGISTNHSSDNLKRMKKDKDGFLSYIFDKYSNDPLVIRRKRIESVDKRIKLKFLKGVLKELFEPKWVYFKYMRRKGF